MSEWPLVYVALRRLSGTGLGKPWVAELPEDWAINGQGSLKFVHGRKRGPDCLVFRLDPAKSYLRQEPAWKRSENDEILAEDDQIAVRQICFCVSPDGALVDLHESG